MTAQKLDLPALSRTVQRGPTGLLYVANCEGCNASAATRWAQGLKAYNVRQLSLVSYVQPRAVTAERIRKSCAAFGVHVSFLLDRSQAARHALNAYFIPRCYLLARGGSLEWIQGPGDQIPTYASIGRIGEAASATSTNEETVSHAN